MALNKAQLIEDLKAIDPSSDNIISKMADAIEKYVKSGTVTVAAGIPVSTAGSAAAQTGATTATGTGTIS